MKKKMKTRRSISRRFKITKTGKVLRGSSFSRHLRTKKKKTQIRRLKKPKFFIGKKAKTIKKMLGR